MEEIISKYPYFLHGLLEAFDETRPTTEKHRLIRERIIANIGDKSVIDRLLPPEEEIIEEPQEATPKSSFDTIDDFLSKFGPNTGPLGYMRELDREEPEKDSREVTEEEVTSSESPEEEIDIEEIVYEEPLEEPEAEKKRVTMPDAEIEKREEKKERVRVESLSSLIKNKRYSEALEIIERQNLNNPQKNIYFADQIRFLRKLIAIENYKTKPKG